MFSNKREIPHDLAALIYRWLRRTVRAGGLISITGAMTVIDVVLDRHRPKISFEHLNEDRSTRYLLIALARAGTIGCSPRDALRAYKWMPIGDYLNGVRINWRVPTDGMLLSDTKHGPNVLHINRQYYSSPPSECRLFAPYFAHPEFYRAGLHNTVLRMRRRERDVKIFFAGTYSDSDSAYSEDFRFPILSRDKILRHLIEKFEGTIEFDADKSGAKSILIVSTSDTRDILDKHKLSIQDYIDAMSRSEFFVCAPGIRMPHSHNLIEAMSVGTVPVTNYHLYMRPPLTPDTNCLAFSTLKEFENAVSRALHMPAGEVQRLRGRVISYYDEYLKPESFGKKLLERPPSISEVVVLDEAVAYQAAKSRRISKM